MKHLVLVFAVLISSLGFSQIDDNWEDVSEKLPGYVITNKGEKLKVFKTILKN